VSKKHLLSRSEVDVDVWEERDRLSIVIRDKKTGQRTIAEWWDDDARQMFEDGFFKGGVELKRSVIAYAEEMGLLAKPNPRSMTLAQWSSKQPYRLQRSGKACSIPDGKLVDRSIAWHLLDYLVSSVSGGSIWFIPRSGVRRNIFAFNNPPSGPADMDSARELELYTENNADLYRQQYIPIVKNLMLKRQKGIYDREKAVKLFMYLMESGAKKYIREFVQSSTPGSLPPKIDTIFNKATREVAARRFRDSFEGEAELGNWDHLLVKVTTRGLKAAVARRSGADEFAQDMAAVEQGYRYKLIRRTKKYQDPGTKTTYAPIYAKSTYEIPKLQKEWPGETWTIVDLASPRSTHENPYRGVRRNIFAFNNPRGKKQLECCLKLGPGASCVKCGKHTHFDIDWLIPSREGNDHRPACSVSCAIQIKKAPRSNPHRSLNAMEQAANAVGLAFGTWAPGDGQTRYRFFVKSKGSPYADYHQGDGLYTALGRKDALAFIAAYGKGRSARTNPRGSIYVIEGFTHHGRRGHSQRRAEFRTPSLAEARARAEQIFKETGVVVAITQENPLTRRESGEEVRQVRTSMSRAMELQRAGHSPSYDLGYAQGVAGVVGRRGTRHAAEVAERAVRHLRYNPPVCSNPLIRGDKLQNHLKQEVLRKFIYRWTSDNTQREYAWRGISGKPRIPLISDAQWLREHAFHVTKAGKLDERHHHAEPGFMAKRNGVRRNPLLQTVMLANPPISVQWDRMGNRQRFELLGFVGYPDNFAASYAQYPWVTLNDSAKRALERQWNDTGSGRSAGTTTRRRRLGVPVGANPLTRREAGKVLSQARAEVRHGSQFRPGHTRSSMAGQAFGRAQTVVRFGPRAARPAARKLIKRAVRVAGTTMSNPGSVQLPAPGTKMTVAQAMDLARRIGNRDLIRQCQEAARLQSKANRGTKCVIWKLLPLGSKTQVETVVALSHYGDSPETMYKPPPGSKKGAHMYRHTWGDGTGKKRPVSVLAAPGGKALITVMGPGQKVGDWMRG
jgi:hypothetical protein